MNAISIYIVEDEIITQRGLSVCLNSLGYEVCGMSADPVQALEEINSLQPDLVFFGY